jgi:HSP20 family protein
MLPIIRRPRMNPLLDAFEGFDSLSRNLDRVFHSVGLSPLNVVKGSDFIPPVNLIEKQNGFEVSVELSGIKQEDISVSVEDNSILVIKGEKKNEKQNEGDEEHFSEICYGVFRRELTFPSSANAEDIQASYHDGVLKIIFPKKEEALPQTRKIAIE